MIPSTVQSDSDAAAGSVMLLGIGNDGRQDDGLGWAFLQRVQSWGSFAGSIHYRFQLQIEDAQTICQAETVIFVDACRQTLPQSYRWQECHPAGELGYTSHQLTPQSVLHLCDQLYGVCPPAYLLLIEGLSWELEIGLSKPAQANLDRAFEFFTRQQPWIAKPGRATSANRCRHYRG